MSVDLDCFLNPKSIALIGASREKNSIGRRILDKLIDMDFADMIYPANPKAGVVHSMKCHSSIDEIEDMAVIAVPKEIVEADLNPVLAVEQRVLSLDARIRIALERGG